MQTKTIIEKTRKEEKKSTSNYKKTSYDVQPTVKRSGEKFGVNFYQNQTPAGKIVLQKTEEIKKEEPVVAPIVEPVVAPVIEETSTSEASTDTSANISKEAVNEFDAEFSEEVEKMGFGTGETLGDLLGVSETEDLANDIIDNNDIQIESVIERMAKPTARAEAPESTEDITKFFDNALAEITADIQSSATSSNVSEIGVRSLGAVLGEVEKPTDIVKDSNNQSRRLGSFTKEFSRSYENNETKGVLSGSISLKEIQKGGAGNSSFGR